MSCQTQSRRAPKPISQDKLDRAFSILERAAIAGHRCPVTSGPDAARDIKSNEIRALAHTGRIRIEISRPNWRTVTLLEGPHAGKSTAPNPKGMRPYLIIDGRGTRTIRR